MSDAEDMHPYLERDEAIEEGTPPSLFYRLQHAAADAATKATTNVPLLGSLVEATRREHDAGGGLLAGGVAYRLSFWLVPVGFAATVAAAMLHTSPAASLETTASTRGLGALMVNIERQAVQASGSAGWMQLFGGLGLAVWFGHGAVQALNVVFAIAWQEPIRRVRRPLVAGLLFTIVTILLLATTAYLNSALAVIGLGTIATVLAKVGMYGAVAFCLAAVFSHGNAPRRALLPGCVVAGLGAVAMHVTVSVYLAPKVTSSVNQFGMLGAAVVILLWLYLLARLISVTAFLNAQLWREHLAAVPADHHSPVT